MNQLRTKYRRHFYIFLIAVAFICSLIAITTRIKMESANKSVEIVLDYNDLETLCNQENISIDAALKKVKEAGVNSIAASEMTIDQLQNEGLLNWTTVSNLMASADFISQDKNKSPKDPGAICLFGYTPEVEKMLIENLSIINGPDSYKKGKVKLQNGKILDVIEITGNPKDTPYLGIGFNDILINKINYSGFNIVIRPENHLRLSGADIKLYIEKIGKYPGATSIIFGGQNEILGYPFDLDNTIEGIKSTGLSYGDVEAPNDKARQKGAEYLGIKLPERTVRVQSITQQYLTKLKPENAVDMFRLGVRERNIRVVYLRLFPRGMDNKSILDTNLDYIRDLKNELTTAGFVTGISSKFPLSDPSPAIIILIALGTAAALMLLIDYFIPDKSWNYALIVFALVILGSVGLVAIGKMYIVQKLSALLIGLVFPTGAFISRFEEAKSIEKEDSFIKVLGFSIKSLIKITLITLAGAIMVGAVLSSTTFMLGINRFSGVKLVMVAPPLFILIYYYLKVAGGGKNSIKDILSKPLYLWQVLALSVLGAIGLVYLMRSGNSGESLTTDEERGLRVSLERILVVRPRFKEFLMGHPALMLSWGMYYVRSFAGLGAVILFAAMGQADIIDTFAHVHTPVIISLLRAVNGLLIGALFGILAFIIFWAIRKQTQLKPDNSSTEDPAYEPATEEPAELNA